MSDLMGAASANDVNLIVLASSSSRQPGTRNWLLQRVELSGLARAIEQSRLGGFLAALAGEGGKVVVRATRPGNARVVLDFKPVSTGGKGTVETIAWAFSGAWSDIVSETAGHVAVSGIRAFLLTGERQAELGRRLVRHPIRAPDRLRGVAGDGPVGLPTLNRWWLRLWPPEVATEYASKAGLVLARLVRGLVYIVASCRSRACPRSSCKSSGCFDAVPARAAAPTAVPPPERTATPHSRPTPDAAVDMSCRRYRRCGRFRPRLAGTGPAALLTPAIAWARATDNRKPVSREPATRRRKQYALEGQGGHRHGGRIRHGRRNGPISRRRGPSSTSPT